MKAISMGVQSFKSENCIVWHRLQTPPPNSVQIFLSPAPVAAALATLGKSLVECTHMTCRHRVQYVLRAVLTL